MKRVLLPVVVLLVGFAAAAALIATGPSVDLRPVAAVVPSVRVMNVEPASVRMRVAARGTVEPRTQSDLVAEVAGRVVWKSPSLVPGGAFQPDEPLLRLETLDYEVALEQAQAARDRAGSELKLAQKNTQRQLDLQRRNLASQADLDDAQSREDIALAALRENQARLRRARTDLARTELRAPFAGRVRGAQVDVGQFVNRGAVLGTLYGTDVAEIRLPIHDQELRFLDLETQQNDNVTVRGNYGGDLQRRVGRVVRTEGALDPRTRMVNVVAEIDDPYGQQSEGAALSVGLFVDAELLGKTFDEVVVLPRVALRGQDQVYVVDVENQLRIRDVEVLRISDDQIYVNGGLNAGERVCLSPLATVVEGMLVRILEEPPESADRFGVRT